MFGSWILLRVFHTKKPPTANSARIKPIRTRMSSSPTIENRERRGGGVWGGIGKGGGANGVPPDDVDPIFPARVEIGAVT